MRKNILNKKNFWRIFLIFTLMVCKHHHISAYESFDNYYKIDKSYLEDILSVVAKDINLPFFESSVPVGINDKSSFILHAARGAGKSAIWQKKIKPALEKRWGILIVDPLKNGGGLESPLDVFVKSRGNTGIFNNPESAIETIAQFWTETDMIDFILTHISKAVLENLGKSPFLNTLSIKKLNPDEKLDFFIITCLYHSEQSQHNLKPLFKLLKDFEQDININWMEGAIKDIKENSPCFKEIADISKNINIIDNAYLNDRLKLICWAKNKANRSYWLNVLRNFDSRQIFEKYIKLIDQMGFKIALIIDGLDEVAMLHITPEKCNNKALVKIVKSMRPIIDAAGLDKINLFLFVPECKDIKMKQLLPEFGKLGSPITYNLDWNEDSLIGYGNFILESLRKTQGWIFRKEFPKTFEKLVGGTICAKAIANKSLQPRRFNIILGEFIKQLNLEAASVDNKFVGSPGCGTVEKAINSAHKNVLFLLDNKNVASDTDDIAQKERYIKKSYEDIKEEL